MPVEAVMLWNEPNNLSPRDIEADSEWRAYSVVARLTGQVVRGESSAVARVLGGSSPIDLPFIRRMVAVHEGRVPSRSPWI